MCILTQSCIGGPNHLGATVARGRTYGLVGGFLLKTTFSVKMLHQTAARVRELLTAGDMAGGRAQMSSLVSRDPSQLTAEQATAATVESVSENIADSIIGPWLAFALFGLPGAVAYRAINTLDSMIGYHGRYEYLGKASARFDDLVNLIPSRLAGLLLVGLFKQRSVRFFNPPHRHARRIDRWGR